MAYHVINYNGSTLGIEMACQGSQWAMYPKEWVTGTLTNAAKVVREWCVAHDIPMVRISKAEYDRGGTGIIAHGDLDPTRRSDPGVGFPWDRFLNMVREGDEVVTEQEIAAIAKAAAEAVWQGSRLGASSGNISMATAVQRTYMDTLQEKDCTCVCDVNTIALAVADMLADRLLE
jgi:N-acetyl-anhydromuramyl-L-alanine amidase AmpD